MSNKDGRQLSTPVSKQSSDAVMTNSPLNEIAGATNITIQFEGREQIQVIIVVIYSLRKQWTT